MLEFDFNYSPWFILVCAVVAGVVSWFMYRGTNEALPKNIRYLLTSLRFIVLFVLCVLLLEPLLNNFTKIESPPIVAIVQDNSESIAIQKDSAYVRQEYPKQLEQFINGFGDDVLTQFYTFSNRLEAGGGPDSLDFNRTGTNISGALEEVQKLYANQNLAAIVLVSDGISTSGANPKYLLDGFRQPVYTVLLGDTTEQKDVRIAEVLYNELAYLGTETPIRVKLQANGYKDQKVEIRLVRKGKTMATQEITFTGENFSQDVNFLIEPDEPGIQQYSIHVTELGGELTYRNNHKSIFINVLETRVRIALFAGASHPDLGALHSALERDDRYEIADFIHKNRTEYYNSPEAVNLGDFDLVILHNYPFSQADAPMVERLVKEIEDRNLPIMAFHGIFTDLPTLAPLDAHLGITATVPTTGHEEVQISFSP